MHRSDHIKSSTNACFQLDPEVNQVIRPSTPTYHASLWNDHFSSNSTCDTKTNTINEQRIEELKKQVKSLLYLASGDLFQEVELIDNIQRLGLAYHFEIEIETMLQRIHDENIQVFNQNVDDCTNLHRVALQFRLLRQAGYYVSHDSKTSTDIFNKFKDEQGKFKSSLTSDVRCILSLYQASYLGFNGEHIMDEATDFTTKHLKSMVTQLSSRPLASEIQRALELPLQKSIDRVDARDYISTYQEDERRNESLLELAKLDYNMVQSIYQSEIREILRWWESMNIMSKLPFEIRDRVVEGYCMVLVLKSEPQYSIGRILLTKIYTIFSVLDDAFDMYGNLEELAPLAYAFQRWDVEEANELPEHMKVIFQEMLNVIDGVEVETITKGQFNGLPYLKQEIKDYTRGLLEEASMLFSGDMPTLEEWLPVALVTIGANCFLLAAVMGAKELAKKEVFDWIASKPKIIRCCYLIVRLCDDIGTFKVEQERGIILSTVTSCMKDNDISESEAVQKLQKRARSLWKDMNEECCKSNPVPMSVLKIILNFTRDAELYYAEGVDGYTNSNGRTKDIVASLLVDPIPI
ncbi:hypothetical protein AQUCO_01100462v1 [Aquilegia coerulea]|uniref:Uncharacterized protein n=1 Tax=Aquilegia coerulea TaxID=218851 RepID=A0A2G5E7E4_AQUCA|nr:hypothetical protein AQUCO_01100462v1 [Aquilegia coerulea]